MAEGLKRLPETRLERLPRMADFALWATACETALWSKGTFLSAYAENIGGAVDAVIDADPVADAVRTMMNEADGVEGNRLGASDRPYRTAGERIAKSKSWPESGRALAGRMRRAATGLRKIGVEIGFNREGRRTRIISITGAPKSFCARIRGGASVRTVRAYVETERDEGIGGVRPADDRRGRSSWRPRSGRPR